MSDPLDPHEGDDPRELARHSENAPGSLLRLRDVQALNRSFRRMAEVQEALLDRLEQMDEARTAQNRWSGPLFAIGGVALGLGVAAAGWFWQQSRTDARGEFVLQQDPPTVNVSPPEVTVQAPDDPALREALGAMNANMSSLLANQEDYRRTLTDLTEKLVASEEEKMALLQEIGRQRAEEEAAARPPAGAAEPAPLDVATPAEPPDSGPGPWVGAFNGLLAADGYPGIRLQKAERVPGEPVLEKVVWMEWNDEGVVDSVTTAARAEFRLHRMTGDLVVRFLDGHRTRDGRRVPLPEDGLRVELSGVDPDPWIEHFPALAETGAAAARAEDVGEAAGAQGGGPPPGTPAPDMSVEEIRRALDELIARKGTFSYYRLSALGAIEDRILRDVQINWHDNSGRLVKTIEADTLVVRLHDNGSVVLQLRNGAFLDGGVRSPFSSDRFSLHLPRQDLADWRASGVPYVEADD